MKREQDKAAKGNTLDKMTEKFKEGPLLLLRRYYKTSVRLQVVTRHASGVRGTAVGEPCIHYRHLGLVVIFIQCAYGHTYVVPHEDTDKGPKLPGMQVRWQQASGTHRDAD